MKRDWKIVQFVSMDKYMVRSMSVRGTASLSLFIAEKEIWIRIKNIGEESGIIIIVIIYVSDNYSDFKVTCDWLGRRKLISDSSLCVCPWEKGMSTFVSLLRHVIYCACRA